MKWQCFKCFTLKDVLTEDIALSLTHLLNKQMCFFDKNVSIEPQFYNYLLVMLWKFIYFLYQFVIGLYTL